MELFRDGPVLGMSGQLDGRFTAEVRTAIYDHLASYDGDVVLDLAGVEWVDVTALRMLAAATRFAERNGQHLTLRGCTPHLRRVLRQTPLRSFLEVDSGAAAG